jgi:F420-dependent oxidoreductase-like protein
LTRPFVGESWYQGGVDIRIFTEPQQGATYDEQLAMAKAAEAAGLDGFFRSDHYLAIGPNSRAASGFGPTDAWITLAGLARETTTIRLGTLLTAGTFRHPGALAIAVAQVDAMSGGRIEFGLGAGWYEQEHLAYGIPFPPSAAERLARLGEQFEVITGMWTTPVGSTFSYSGEYYQLSDGPALPKPLQQPTPPVIVGGRGLKKTPALAARFAAEWNVPFQPVDAMREIRTAAEVACEDAGRDPSTLRSSLALATVIGASAGEVERRVIAVNRDPEELKVTGLYGSPADIAERLAEYASFGISRIYLQLLDITDLEQVALIGSELAPLVAEL